MDVAVRLKQRVELTGAVVKQHVRLLVPENASQFKILRSPLSGGRQNKAAGFFPSRHG